MNEVTMEATTSLVNVVFINNVGSRGGSSEGEGNPAGNKGYRV
jgi:hypothetical protein